MSVLFKKIFWYQYKFILSWNKRCLQKGQYTFKILINIQKINIYTIICLVIITCRTAIVTFNVIAKGEINADRIRTYSILIMCDIHRRLRVISMYGKFMWLSWRTLDQAGLLSSTTASNTCTKNIGLSKLSPEQYPIPQGSQKEGYLKKMNG